MNLRSLENKTLLTKTESLVREERRITTSILWHLHEIDRRKLFAELGFASLFEYCTLHLKYSAGAAQRRISSMRLLRELPEIEEKINTGELNVSSVAQVQSLFRQARVENKAFTLEAKRELVERLENKSHKDCEKILAEVNPGLSRPTRERVIVSDKTEIRFEATAVLYEKIQRLKGKYAHKLRGSTDFADLLEILVDQALENKKPKQSVPTLEVEVKQNTNDAARSTSPLVGASRAMDGAPRADEPWKGVPQKGAGGRATLSRYIPIRIKTKALEKSNYKCSYKDPITKRECTSIHALEFDHIKPRALGGLTEDSNIRVLCRNHNQHAAIQQFGIKKMEKFLLHQANNLHIETL